MEIVRGIIFCSVLLYASVKDIKYREVGNHVPLMLAITALIGTSLPELPAMLLAAAVVAIPQIVMMLILPNTYGGADLKISTACAFFLGITGGVTALIFGLLLAVICTCTYRAIKKQNMKESFPLVPYLSIGAVGAWLINILA